MKTNDLLMYGGIAVIAYLFLKPKTVAPGVMQVAPVQAYVPPVQQSNTANTLLTAAAGLAPVVAKFFTPTPQPAPAPLQVADMTASNIVAPALTSTLPTDLPAVQLPTPSLAYQPVTTDAYMQMFQNNSYPGAELSGISPEIAACIGEY